MDYKRLVTLNKKLAIPRKWYNIDTVLSSQLSCVVTLTAQPHPPLTSFGNVTNSNLCNRSI